MKVLFAVNDENISASIVKKYQKQYKEIISYKNVYYFNAILKELQRNKTYDRVVISEDLEEFTSSSYAQKDKFIFDRLDSITDEAVAQDGNDIPIILICSERRAKAEEILIKIFGIGIYNAIIGDDRSIDEVCRLINKPRSKKEAKNYYKIDSEDVNYERENDSEVSEMEMQNILVHFKKLGKNEDRYADSFRNIVSQYNEKQLRVIIAILPDNVKEVLEERSPEYQKIVFPNGKKQTLSTNKTRKNDNTKKKTSEKLLNANNNMRLTKPVVVPTTMETSIYKRVDAKKTADVDLDELEDEDFLEGQYINDIEPMEEKPKRRGRPRKNPIVENTVAEEKPKRRGRPKKVTNIEEVKSEDKTSTWSDKDQDNYEDDFILPQVEDNQPEYSQNSFNNEPEEDYDDTSILPGFEESESTYESDDDDSNIYSSRNNYSEPKRIDKYNNTNYMEEYNTGFRDDEFESLLSGDKKIVSFVGTSKNGTSFIINNIAQILSNLGVDTAILDTTKNKNSYYIYTKNDEDLRRTAISSIKNLLEGKANGVKVNNKLSVYTTIPSQSDERNIPDKIMETLLRNHSLVLVDCDFDSPYEYFTRAQELYLVQTMDVLTIQPLTSFLRDLKVKNILDESKIRIILNKLLRVKGVNGKNIIGGMSNYNDPEMSFMTELFDRNLVRVSAQIPFDEDVYAKYLESIVECEIKLNGYPKEFKQKLSNLSEIIYPLLPNKKINGKNKKTNKEKTAGYTSSFSSEMNDTLNNMRKRY